MRPNHSLTKTVCILCSLALFRSVLAAPESGPASASSPPQSQPALSPAERQPEPDDAQWVMAAKNYANTRYSGLNQINAGNVASLKVAWTFSTGVNRGQEAAPIVVGTMMYVATPYPNIVYALDLANSERPMKWKFEPKPSASAQGVACCDVVNRGAAYSNGKVFFNTLDGQTIALDGSTGREIWRTRLGNINIGETVTMSPVVVRGKVLVGNSGGEFGVRGWLTALDENDGHVVWKAWSTGPDADCLIGPEFKPYYEQDRGKDLGVKTWPPDHWKIGGGNVWGWISYDPELNLIYYGTGNPGVWNPELRPGDNKWSCGVFARNPDTGQARWFYQCSPHDLFDHDGVNESVLIDTNWEGKPRKLLIHPDRSGYLFFMDRATGEVVAAPPFCRNTASKGVDLKTGRTILNDEKTPQTGKVIRDISPISSGAKDWSPSSYSPLTGLYYVQSQNLSMDYEGVEANYIEGTPYVGVNEKTYPGPGGHRGELQAWDVTNARKVWTIKENFPIWSGTITTAGELVFYGTLEGWFKAVHARTGKELWRFKTGSGIIGQPTTFRGPDGKQYVAILSGIGGWIGALVAADLDARDPTAALGLVGAVADLPKVTTKGGTLYVFSLP